MSCSKGGYSLVRLALIVVAGSMPARQLLYLLPVPAKESGRLGSAPDANSSTLRKTPRGLSSTVALRLRTIGSSSRQRKPWKLHGVASALSSRSCELKSGH